MTTARMRRWRTQSAAFGGSSRPSTCINKEIAGDLSRLVILHDGERRKNLPIVLQIEGFRILKAG
jgi:hypothetical protein